MKKIILFSMFLCICFSINALSVEEVYKTIFSDNADLKSIFSADFLQVLPPEKIIEVVKIYKNSLGNFKSVEKNDDMYKVIFEKGFADSRISFNSDNLVNSLWFGGPQLTEDDFDKIIKDFSKIAEHTSITIIKNNKDYILKHNHDKKLGVGSAFKLYVLRALDEKIKRRETGWSRVVFLKDELKTLPSGILQEWPDMTPVTLKTLANLMIQFSDNTATDILIDYLKPEYIEKFSPKSIAPFMSTSQMFNLKLGTNHKFRVDYSKSDLKQQRRILNSLKKQFSMDDESVRNWKNPIDVDLIEWFVSTDDLCRVIYELRNNNSININPGTLAKKDWEKIGFKGGSEPGVFNLTYILQKKNSRDFYAISATANDNEKVVEQKEFINIVNRLANLINR
ncbi:MAG: serine hydrolase [Candidatus Muiribacteriota bacterium]